jgi:putative ATP-binding cassette transporter
MFCIIAAMLLVLNVGQAWLTQAIKLKFRKGIVVDLLDQWLPRAYRLAHAGAIGANPDQRIHEGIVRSPLQHTYRCQTPP